MNQANTVKHQGMYLKALKNGGLAVVTGAANGVGRTAALRFAQAGLGVILADLPGNDLTEAEQEVAKAKTDGATIKAIPTDVSKAETVHALADAAFAAGEVAVLMNNAGVALPTSSWGKPESWRQMTEVNFFGVLNGIHAFVPRMIEAKRPAVVINTGSKQGITLPPGNPGYNVSKAAVKAMTEMLAYDLREAKALISAHLFVPGFTYTQMIKRFMPQKPDGAWTSEETVDYFIKRMSEGDFYILCPDNEVSRARDMKRVEWAAGDIIENRAALSRWHPDYTGAFNAHEKA